MAEIWFFGTPMDSYSTTISQFLDAIEGTGDWSDEEKKTFALNHLKGPAENFSQEKQSSVSILLCFLTSFSLLFSDFF